MRVFSVLAVAFLACNDKFAVSEEANFNAIVDSGDTYTLYSQSAHDNRGVRQRSLRSVDKGNTETRDDEERVFGTELVQKVHKLPWQDAKIVRQIAKGNSPEHILDKLKVPYELINGQRVYSRENPIYAKYLYWLKRARDNPLTYN
ncbi:Putative RxLR effector [Phytophthora palmivora]|uniref:RxLR effector protein n=1 Tax=Phytophthora palmivora TaxID=4796 RepID=A0A2P4WYH6_9STRA|nr:Putative RxLR effector [Phytophthora palmivora]